MKSRVVLTFNNKAKQIVRIEDTVMIQGQSAILKPTVIQYMKTLGYEYENNPTADNENHYEYFNKE